MFQKVQNKKVISSSDINKAQGQRATMKITLKHNAQQDKLKGIINDILVSYSQKKKSCFLVKMVWLLVVGSNTVITKTSCTIKKNSIWLFVHLVS